MIQIFCPIPKSVIIRMVRIHIQFGTNSITIDISIYFSTINIATWITIKIVIPQTRQSCISRTQLYNLFKFFLNCIRENFHFVFNSIPIRILIVGICMESFYFIKIDKSISIRIYLYPKVSHPRVRNINRNKIIINGYIIFLVTHKS